MKLPSVKLPTGQSFNLGDSFGLVGGFMLLIVAFATAQMLVGKVVAPITSKVPGGFIDTSIEPLASAPVKVSAPAKVLV